MSLADPTGLVNLAMADNPHLSNPDLIKPGQLIFVRTKGTYNGPLSSSVLTDLKGANQAYRSMTASEKKLSSAIAPYVKTGSDISQVAAGTFEKTIKGNTKYIQQIITDFDAYKAGALTKNQYSYQRKLNLAKFQKHTAPVSKIINGGQPAHQVYRMKPGRAHNPTAPMKAQVHHLSKAAKAAKVGGYVLTAVNVGISCHQIANTKSRVGKNRVLFETVGGMAAGAGAVALIGLAVTPVGWVAILAVAAAGAVAGYAGGKAAVAMYDGHGKKYDVVQTLGIDTVCNPDSGIGSL